MILSTLLPVLGVVLLAVSVLRFLRATAAGESQLEAVLTGVVSVAVIGAAWWLTPPVRQNAVPEDAPKIALLPFDLSERLMDPEEASRAQLTYDLWASLVVNTVHFNVLHVRETAEVMPGLSLVVNGSCDAACGLHVATALHAAGFALVKFTLGNHGQNAGVLSVYDRQGTLVKSTAFSGDTAQAAIADLKRFGPETFLQLLRAVETQGKAP